MSVDKPQGALAHRDVKRRGGAVRHKRLDIRLSAEVKDLVQHAAAINGQSLSEYVLSRVQEAAKHDIHTHEVLTLSVRDSARFADLLLNPPEPNATLVAAAQRHDAMIVS